MRFETYLIFENKGSPKISAVNCATLYRRASSDDHCGARARKCAAIRREIGVKHWTRYIPREGEVRREGGGRETIRFHGNPLLSLPSLSPISLSHLSLFLCSYVRFSISLSSGTVRRVLGCSTRNAACIQIDRYNDKLHSLYARGRIRATRDRETGEEKSTHRKHIRTRTVVKKTMKKKKEKERERKESIWNWITASIAR